MSKASGVVQRYLWVSLAISFILGLVIGLVVLGWTIWPVQWTNATPADLHQAWQRTYLTMAADSYALTGDATAARERLNAMVGPKHDLVKVTEDIRDIASARSKAGDTTGAARLLALATAITGAPSAGPTSAAPTQAAPTAGPTKAGTVAATPAPTKTGSGAATQATPVKSGNALKGTTPLSSFLRIVGLVILVLVVIAGLLLLLYFLQARSSEPTVEAALTPVDATVKTQTATTTPPTANVPPAVVTPPPLTVVPPVTTAPVPTPAPAAVISTPPPAPSPATLGPFVATYNLGDVDFDMSFGIESPNGDFLGECGLGTADTTGSGDVQRVTAFEVWLFDKTDIRTVSVVLASAHAFEDAALHTKLAARGDVILAKPGEAFTVKTTSLQLQGRILDMAYGGEPAESYFTTFSVELTPAPQAKS